MHKDDLDYQKIVWRDNSGDEIQDWKLSTVAYGMAATPFLAIRCLRQLAVDEAQQYPRASKVVLSDLYVNDMLFGCDKEEDASQLQAELVEAWSPLGGFQLRKWSTNNQNILNLIQEDQRPLVLSEKTSVIPWW